MFPEEKKEGEQEAKRGPEQDAGVGKATWQWELPSQRRGVLGGAAWLWGSPGCWDREIWLDIPSSHPDPAGSCPSLSMVQKGAERGVLSTNTAPGTGSLHIWGNSRARLDFLQP